MEEEDDEEEQDSKEEVVQQALPLVKEKKKKKGKEPEPLLDKNGKGERGKTIRTIIGPMGKLHNHIVHIRSLANRTTWFVKHASKMIPLDNCTRWNS